METFTDRIKNRIQALGITQARLAELIGIKQPSVNALLKGGIDKPRFILKLAAALETTPDWLLSGKETPDTGAAKLAAAQMIAAKAVTELAAPAATSANLRAFVMKRVADTLSASDAADFEALLTSARKDAADFAKAMGRGGAGGLKCQHGQIKRKDFFD